MTTTTNMRGAMHHAQQHSNGEDESLFSSALGFLGGNKHQYANEEIDEGQAVQAHQAMYGGGGQQQQQQHGSETVGAGAAIQALKMFTGGGSGSGSNSGMGGGGGGGAAGGKNAFIGMAMGQASKLFDQQSANGNLVSSIFSPSFPVSSQSRYRPTANIRDPQQAQGADKQSAVTKAGEMALKMYLKSQMGGSSTGGGGGLASLATKFM